MGGYMTEFIRQFAGGISGTPLRFAGSYQDDETEEVTAIEVVMRGRFTEIDSGNSKVGDDTEQTFKAALTYCKLLENGREIFEVDMLNAILKVDGKDKLAEHRKAIGL